MLRPNSILYHCNDSTRCQKFLQDHTYVIESQEDGIWLGSGMYFWDNIVVQLSRQKSKLFIMN